MTRFIAPLLAAASLLASACVSTHHVARPASVAELADRAEADSAGGIIYPAIRPLPGVAAPRAATGLTMSAPLEAVSPDRVYLAGQGGQIELPLSDVRGYTVKRRAIGAVEGGAIGLVVGAVVGAAVGYSMGSDPKPVEVPCETDTPFGCGLPTGHPERFTATQKSVMGGILGGVTAAATGAILGALIGHQDRFVF